MTCARAVDTIAASVVPVALLFSLLRVKAHELANATSLKGNRLVPLLSRSVRFALEGPPISRSPVWWPSFCLGMAQWFSGRHEEQGR
jgi:hypothetical protein